MAVYNPPSANLPEFDTAVFEPSDVALTYSLAKKYFLTYPVAQGAETLQKVGQSIGLNNIQFGDILTFNSINSAAAVNNVALGYGTLPALTSGLQNTAIGNSSGTATTTGSNNTFIGYNTGATAAVGHSYLTCIGSNSGSATDPVGNNRILLGSSTGQETVYLAGTAALQARVTSNTTYNLFTTATSTNTINLFTGAGNSNTVNFCTLMTTSCTMNIGTAISGAGSKINIGTSLGITEGIQLGSSSAGSVRIGNILVIGPSGRVQCPTYAGQTNGTGDAQDYGAVTTSAAVTFAKDVTTGAIAIGGAQTSANITLGQNTSDAGRIVMNRNIVLPSTGFATPAAGELGYSTTRTATLTSTTTFTGTTTAINSTIGEIARMTFPSVGVFNLFVRVRWTRTGSNNAIAGRLGLSTANNTITDQAGSVGNYYWTGSLWNTTPAAMDYMGVFTQVVTNSSTTYYLTGQFCFSTGTDTLVADDVSFFVTRIA